MHSGKQGGIIWIINNRKNQSSIHVYNSFVKKKNNEEYLIVNIEQSMQIKLKMYIYIYIFSVWSTNSQ